MNSLNGTKNNLFQPLLYRFLVCFFCFIFTFHSEGGAEKAAEARLFFSFFFCLFYLMEAGGAPKKLPLCLVAARDGAKPSSF